MLSVFASVIPIRSQEKKLIWSDTRPSTVMTLKSLFPHSHPQKLHEAISSFRTLYKTTGTSGLIRKSNAFDLRFKWISDWLGRDTWFPQDKLLTEFGLSTYIWIGRDPPALRLLQTFEINLRLSSWTRQHQAHGLRWKNWIICCFVTYMPRYMFLLFLQKVFEMAAPPADIRQFKHQTLTREHKSLKRWSPLNSPYLRSTQTLA